MSIYCLAKNCFNCTTTAKNLTFFYFPRDDKRCREWIRLCERHDLLQKSEAELYRSRFMLCAEHFNDSQFYSEDTKDKLMPDAMPSMFSSMPKGSSLQPFCKTANSIGCKLQDFILRKYAMKNGLALPKTESPGLLEQQSSRQNTLEEDYCEIKIEIEDPEVNGDHQTSRRPTECGTVHRDSPEDPMQSDDLSSEVESIDENDVHQYSQISSNSETVGQNPSESALKKSNDAFKIKRLKRLLSAQRKHNLLMSKKIRCLKQRVARLEKEKSLEYLMETVSSRLTKSARLLINSQLQLALQKRSIKEWTNEELQFTNSLLMRSQTTYNFLRTIFKLPSRTALQSWVNKNVCPFW